MDNKTIVLVTGASGYIATHVVRLLLQRDAEWQVRGTVRSLTADAKVAHLRALPGAAERLELVEADLLDEESIRRAVKGMSICIHTASPFFNKSEDPENDLVKPAVEGTKAVLGACKEEGVQKLVLTSSTASIFCKTVESGYEFTEGDWSDEALMKEKGFFYPLSKTLAERAAWDFLERNGGGKLQSDGSVSGREEGAKVFSLAVMCPCLVCGPQLQPTLNTSSEVLMQLCDGSVKEIRTGRMTWVDVRDVALAHVVAAEKSNADGRFILFGEQAKWSDVVEAIQSSANSLPAGVLQKVPSKLADPEKEGPDRYNQKNVIKANVERAERELGIRFTPIKTAVRDHVQSSGFQKHLQLL